MLFTTYTVIDVMLIMCLLAFFVTSADKSQLFVYLCYLLIYCLRLFVVQKQCLCGVVDVVLHNYVNKLSWPLLTIGIYLQVHLAYL